MGSKNSGPKSISTLTGPQQALMGQLLNMVTPNTVGPNGKPTGSPNLSQSLIGQGATPYNQQIVPNLLPQYQQGMNLIQGYNPNAFSPQLSQAAGSVLGGQAPMQVKPNLISPNLPRNYLSSITSPLMHTFQTQIAPQIKEGFGNVGAFSSAQGSALGNALGNIGAQITQQYGQAQLGQLQQSNALNAQAQQTAQYLNVGSANAAAQRQLVGIPEVQNLQLNPLSQASAISSALNPFQSNLASQYGAQYQNFLRTAPENSPWTQLALGLTSQQQQAFYNPAQQGGLLGGIAGMTAGSSLGSLMGAASIPFAPLASPLGFLAGIAGL